MKINIVLLIIALAIAALAGYGFYAANSQEGDVPLLIAVVAGILLFITLAGTIAFDALQGRGSVANIRVVSGIFFFILLIEQIIFSIAPFRVAPYIIVSGVSVLVYALIAYAIGKALKNT